MARNDETYETGHAMEAIDGLSRFMPLESENSGYGASVFIGSRSTICRLYDLQTGELVTHTWASGDYASFSGTQLKELMTDVLETLASSAGIAFSSLKVAVVSGSTPMERRAAGVKVEELIYNPSAGCDNFGCDVEYMLVGSSAIAVGQAFFTPCLDDALGGDFLCGLLAIDVLGSEEPVLYACAEAGNDPRVLLACGDQDGITAGVLAEGASLGEGFERLLAESGASLEAVSRVFVTGDVPEQLLDVLGDRATLITNPAIEGTSAVLLSEEAEDELCNLVSECRFVEL